jgi:hypothetical protein
VGNQSAKSTPPSAPTIAATRATESSCLSVAWGRRNRLYRSWDSDVASMKRSASQVLTSAEKTAASPNAPSITGSWSASTVGSTRFGSVISGFVTRAAMPNRGGTNANRASATACHPIPARTARSLDAP